MLFPAGSVRRPGNSVDRSGRGSAADRRVRRPVMGRAAGRRPGRAARRRGRRNCNPGGIRGDQSQGGPAVITVSNVIADVGVRLSDDHAALARQLLDADGYVYLIGIRDGFGYVSEMRRFGELVL